VEEGVNRLTCYLGGWNIDEGGKLASRTAPVRPMMTRTI
jgi:hypothetical protein